MASYIELWQKALQKEIMYLKTFGNTKIQLSAGQLITNAERVTYFFETSEISSKIPVGSQITLIVENGRKLKGRMLSSEGRNVIIEMDTKIMGSLEGLVLQYDPWELLDQLFDRLGSMKESKRKRARIQRLMNPNNSARHPSNLIRSSVHELLLRSKYNPVTYVWGPPGTGKTYTLARVAANKYLKGKKVLILAQSNQAVDVLMLEVYKVLSRLNKVKVGDIIRYGTNLNQEIEHTPLTMEYILSQEDAKIIEEKNALSIERSGIKTDLSSSFSRRDSARILEIEEKLAIIRDTI